MRERRLKMKLFEYLASEINLDNIFNDKKKTIFIRGSVWGICRNEKQKQAGKLNEHREWRKKHHRIEAITTSWGN